MAVQLKPDQLCLITTLSRPIRISIDDTFHNSFGRFLGRGEYVFFPTNDSQMLSLADRNTKHMNSQSIGIYILNSLNTCIYCLILVVMYVFCMSIHQSAVSVMVSI